MTLLSSDRSRDHRPVILTFSEFYFPGHKGGGPIRSVFNLVAALGDEFDFQIVTTDRDLGDLVPYPGIRVNCWQEVGKAKVFYTSPGLARWWRIATLVRTGNHDMFYLNSFFSRPFSMLPAWLCWLGWARRVPLLLAPRGEFSPGALKIKALRKQVYLTATSLARVYRDTVFHVSTPLEQEDLKRAGWANRRLLVGPHLVQTEAYVASDIPEAQVGAPLKEGVFGRRKSPNSLEVAFVSRISRTKNLDAALTILAGVQGDVRFHIYGPAEDTAYWAHCRRLIQRLPSNVQVEYRGQLLHCQVLDALRQHHVFFLPTCGENFGHVILEALLAGCAVLISDQTPWRQLREKGVGWDLPLDQPAAFRQAIQECVEMDDAAFEKLSRQAERYGLEAAADPTRREENRVMFHKVLGSYNSKGQSGKG